MTRRTRRKDHIKPPRHDCNSQQKEEEEEEEEEGMYQWK